MSSVTSPLPVLRALADPTRLRIVALVRRLELAVGELALVLGQSQPRVSRHLKILADAGLIERAKEGAWVFVRLADAPHVAPALALIDHWNDGGDADRARLADVRAERAAAAAAYFATHAAAWDGIRALHIAEADVEAAIVDVLGDAPIGRLLDVGTGTGRMIELLGGRATSAIGVDRSPEMLRLARGRIEAAGLACRGPPRRHVRPAAPRWQRRHRRPPPGPALRRRSRRGHRRSGARRRRRPGADRRLRAARPRGVPRRSSPMSGSASTTVRSPAGCARSVSTSCVCATCARATPFR